MRHPETSLPGRAWPVRAAAALSVALLAGMLGACGGGGSSASQPLDNGGGGSGNPSTLAASRPGDLLALVRATLQARQAQRESTPGVALDAVAAPALGLVTTASGTPVAKSNTTVQESGVDEDDLLKSDGEMVYALDPQGRTAAGVSKPQLLVQRLGADGRLQDLQALALPVDAATYTTTRGMQLATAARRLAVLGASVTPIGDPSPCPPGAMCIAGNSLVYWPGSLKSTVQVQVVELGATGKATLGTSLSLSGQLVGSRLIGNTLYLVSTYVPSLAVDALPATASAADREALLARLTVADVLPTISVSGGAPQALLADTDCYVQPKNASLTLQFTTITAIDLASPALTRASRCFAGGTEAMYMSPASLYLATTRYAAPPMLAGIRYAPQTTTDIHKFSMNGLAIDYRGSGEVSGHLGWDPDRKAYRMSENGGDLRVISFTGEVGWATLDGAGAKDAPAPSPATLSILRERASDHSLQVLATLPNAKRPAPLGHAGEQVYAVRFIGDRGYLVTFRQSDPLYVLNLADPADPQQVGELAMPGFSDYLFAVGDGLLLGVGKEADASGRVGGVKAALMDVRDASRPALLSALVFGSRGSYTALDGSSHGINLFQRGSVLRVAIPMALAGADPGTPWQAGLQRLEVDTQARTLAARKMIPSPLALSYPDIYTDRSLQIGDQLAYLSQGQLGAWPW
jgi:hypothetical protein